VNPQDTQTQTAPTQLLIWEDAHISCAYGLTCGIKHWLSAVSLNAQFRRRQDHADGLRCWALPLNDSTSSVFLHIPGSKPNSLLHHSCVGKTTLMDCVAGRKTIGDIRGDITVNGHPKVGN
jgi:hypothetical protein